MCWWTGGLSAGAGEGNRDRVPSRVSLQWTECEKVLSMEPFQRNKCDNVPLKAPLQWTKCSGVPFMVPLPVDKHVKVFLDAPPVDKI